MFKTFHNCLLAKISALEYFCKQKWWKMVKKSLKEANSSEKSVPLSSIFLTMYKICISEKS